MKFTIEIPDENIAALAALLSGGSAAPAVAGASNKPGPKAKEKPAAPAVTLDDLRTAAGLCVKAGKKTELAALVKTFGADKITELDVSKHAEALAAFKALAEEEVDPLA